jgi:hypothetical protein
VNLFILFLVASMLVGVGWRRWHPLVLRAALLALCGCAAVGYYFFNKL